MYYQYCCVLSNSCHQLLPEIVHLQSCCHQTVETNHQSRACFGPFFSESKWTADGALFILSHHLRVLGAVAVMSLHLGRTQRRQQDWKYLFIKASLDLDYRRSTKRLEVQGTSPHFWCRPMGRHHMGEKVWCICWSNWKWKELVLRFYVAQCQQKLLVVRGGVYIWNFCHRNTGLSGWGRWVLPD